jgi:hypothetical protein
MQKWLSFICFFILFSPAISHAAITTNKSKAPSMVGAAVECINPSSIESFGLPAFYTISSHPVSQNTNSFQGNTGSQPAFYAPDPLRAFSLPVGKFGNNQLSYNYHSHHFW